jgi:TatD DNase family protein
VIDTHCHLDRVPDLAAALENDLRAMVTVGTDAARSEDAVRLAERAPRVWAVVGVHPNDADRAADPVERGRIEALAAHPRVVAIGETGVDTYWDAAPIDAQLEAMAWQVGLARRVGKPVVLHVRDADGADDASRAAASALREHGYPRGVLHCTNGHEELVATGLELGWYVSFAGNVTYPKAALLHETAARVPEDRVLVETDALFMAPVPERGRKNLPGFVRHTARHLALLRSTDPAALEAVLDANAIRLFGFPPSGPPGSGLPDHAGRQRHA